MGAHEVIGSQIKAVEFLLVALEFLGQCFFAQVVTIFQGELDKDLVEPGAGQQVIHGLIDFSLEPVIFVADEAWNPNKTIQRPSQSDRRLLSTELHAQNEEPDRVCAGRACGQTQRRTRSIQALAEADGALGGSEHRTLAGENRGVENEEI